MIAHNPSTFSDKRHDRIRLLALVITPNDFCIHYTSPV